MWPNVFEGEDPGVGVHEGGVDGDRVAERLHGHGHVDDDDAVLRGGLADADVLVKYKSSSKRSLQVLCTRKISSLGKINSKLKVVQLHTGIVFKKII